MKIKRLRAKNIFCYETLDLNFDKHPVTQIIGYSKDEKKIVDAEEGTHSAANGVGKSSIYYIITETLYSKNHSKIQKSFIGNMFLNKPFQVIMDLEIKDVEYQLTYSEKECILTKNGEIVVKGRKNVSDFFENLIPYELFLSITYMSPEYKIPYFSDTDKYKKDFIKLIFDDLNRYLEPYADIKKALEDKNKDILALTGALSVLDSKRNEVILPLKEVPSLVYPNFNVAELDDLKNQVMQLMIRQKEMQQILKKEAELTDKIKELDNLPECNEPSDISDIEKKVIELSVELKKLEPLNGKNMCPTCMRPVDQDKYIEHRKSITESIRQFNEEIASHRAEVQKWKTLENQREMLRKFSEELSTLPKILSDEKILEEKIHELKDLQRKRIEEYNYLKEEYEKQEAIVEEIQRFNQTQEVKALLKEEAERDYQESLTMLNNLKFEVTNLQLLLATFSDTGIIQSKFPERLQLLNSEINNELRRYTGKLSLQFKMHNGKITEILYKADKEYPVNNCSTGEKTRINLGLLFATRKMLKELKGIECNLLFFDEIFGSLDALGRQLLLGRLATLNTNSFIISHSYFNSELPYIQVIQENNISRAEEHDAETTIY